MHSDGSETVRRFGLLAQRVPVPESELLTEGSVLQQPHSALSWMAQAWQAQGRPPSRVCMGTTF